MMKILTISHRGMTNLWRTTKMLYNTYKSFMSSMFKLITLTIYSLTLKYKGAV